MVQTLVSFRDNLNRFLDPLVQGLRRFRRVLQWILLLLAWSSLAFLFFPFMQRDLGEWAWYILIFLLFLRPMAEFTGLSFLRGLLVFRKELGILMSLLAIEHCLLFFFGHPDGFGVLFLGEYWWTPEGAPTFISFGTIALFLIIPLFLTSNNWSRICFGRYWKMIHRMAYAILLLVVLHVAFLRYDFFSALVLFLLFGFVHLLSYLRNHKFFL